MGVEEDAPPRSFVFFSVSILCAPSGSSSSCENCHHCSKSIPRIQLLSSGPKTFGNRLDFLHGPSNYHRASDRSKCSLIAQTNYSLEAQLETTRDEIIETNSNTSSQVRSLVKSLKSQKSTTTRAAEESRQRHHVRLTRYKRI